MDTGLNTEEALRLFDNVRFKGLVQGWLIGPDGRLKQYIESENLVVTTGLQHIIDQLYSSPAQGKMSHYAIGTGTNIPAAGDTALQTEVGRVALDPQVKNGVDLTYIGAFIPGVGTGDITEGGIFNASSSGVMLARVKFAAVTKTASDTFIIQHKITAGV